MADLDWWRSVKFALPDFVNGSVRVKAFALLLFNTKRLAFGIKTTVARDKSQQKLRKCCEVDVMSYCHVVLQMPGSVSCGAGQHGLLHSASATLDATFNSE